MRTLYADLRAGLMALRPGRFPYARFMAALALGILGGWLFSRAGLPLPWMLGPMTFCTAAAVLRLPIAAPTVVRPPMTVVIGVMLGSSFTPAVAAAIPTWWPTVLGLALFVGACAVACVLYFRLLAGFDPVTAYFAGMPGGLAEMVVVGEERGGDGRVIALVHSARILLIVFAMPFLIRLVGGVEVASGSQGGVGIAEAPWSSEAWIAACGIAGVVLGHAARVPAKFLLGPMVVSAAVHLGGLSDFVPPREIVNGAQVVLGTTIGCRFVGTPPREILRILALSVGSTALLLAITGVFGVAVSQVSGHGVPAILLAYSPGGLAEMSLVALALHLEVAFVAAHHIIRIFLVMIAAPPAFALLNRGRRPPGP